MLAKTLRDWTCMAISKSIAHLGMKPAEHGGNTAATKSATGNSVVA